MTWYLDWCLSELRCLSCVSKLKVLNPSIDETVDFDVFNHRPTFKMFNEVQSSSYYKLGNLAWMSAALYWRSGLQETTILYYQSVAINLDPSVYISLHCPIVTIRLFSSLCSNECDYNILVTLRNITSLLYTLPCKRIMLIFLCAPFHNKVKWV